MTWLLVSVSGFTLVSVSFLCFGFCFFVSVSFFFLSVSGFGFRGEVFGVRDSGLWLLVSGF